MPTDGIASPFVVDLDSADRTQCVQVAQCSPLQRLEEANATASAHADLSGWYTRLPSNHSGLAENTSGNERDLTVTQVQGIRFPSTDRHMMSNGGTKMRDPCRSLLAVVLTLISIFACVAGVGGAAAAADTGSITGCVQTDEGTPISGAHVVAYRWETDMFAAEAWTSENGSYRLAGLTLARYRIKADAARYLPEYYRDGTHTPVTVIPPYSTDNIDFTLTPGSSISGHVYQDDRSNPDQWSSSCSLREGRRCVGVRSRRVC